MAAIQLPMRAGAQSLAIILFCLQRRDAVNFSLVVHVRE